MIADTQTGPSLRKRNEHQGHVLFIRTHDGDAWSDWTLADAATWDGKNPIAKPERLDPRDWRMCGKKRRYGTQQRAVVQASRSTRRAGYIRTYKCPRCKGWHLTHKEEMSA